MSLPHVADAEAAGALRAIYDELRARPLPAVYRPTHGGVAGVVAAHGLDPDLARCVFACATTLGNTGPLAWHERELVALATSRLDRCRYGMASHGEFLRAARAGDEALTRAVIAEPRAVAASWKVPRERELVALAAAVTEAPWTLSRADRARAHAAGLADDDLLQAILLAAQIGHTNRIVDAVGVPLDYAAAVEPPRTDPAAPAFLAAPAARAGRPALDVSRRATSAAALASWRVHSFSRDAPLTRRQRTVIARGVAAWLGDASISPPEDLTVNPLDAELFALARVVTLAPWQLADASFAALRANGFDDAALFDACATASSAGVFSRIEVALVALGQDAPG